MESISEIFDIAVLPYVLLVISPPFYLYLAKGDVPYKFEEKPKAAFLVVTLECFVVHVGIALLLAVPWRYFFDMPLFLSLIGVPFLSTTILIQCYYYYCPYREAKIKREDIREYAHRRYMPILKSFGRWE